MKSMFSCFAFVAVLSITSIVDAADIPVGKWKVEAGNAVADVQLPANSKIRLQLVNKTPNSGPLSLKINGKDVTVNQIGDLVYGQTTGNGKVILSCPTGAWNAGLQLNVTGGKDRVYFFQIWVIE